jgi:hypothetical protein
MSDTLRSSVIRLAHSIPELRSALLPLLEREASAPFNTDDKVWVPSEFLKMKSQESYLGVIENAYSDGAASVRVKDPNTFDYSHVPLTAMQARKLRPYKPGDTVQVTYNQELDSLMDAWSKQVKTVLKGQVLSKKQVNTGGTLYGLLQVSSDLLPSGGGPATFHFEFRTGGETWSVSPTVRPGDTLKNPAKVKMSRFTTVGMPVPLRRAAGTALTLFLSGMTASAKTASLDNRKKMEDEVAAKFPPDSKSGRGSARVLMLTGNAAKALGRKTYEKVKMSDLSDDEIVKLHDLLVLGKR